MIDQLFMKDLARDIAPPLEPVEQPATLLAAGPATLDVGQVTVQGYKPGQDTAGGAFVGTRLNTPKTGQAQPTQQDREKLAIGLLDSLAGALRGAVAQTIGLPGDIRSIVDLISKEGADKYLGQAVMPTTEEMLAGTALPPVLGEGATNIAERQPTVETAEQVGTFLPAPGIPEAATSLVKGAAKAIKATKGLPVGLSIEDVSKSVPDQVKSDNFKSWFGDWVASPENASKVVDETGAPLAVYHGTGRPDRVGTQFRKSRATSGPMSFFTDNPEVASGYAKGKTDTSIAYEDNAYDYANWFKKKVGRSTLNLDQAGARMTSQERQDLIDKLRDITMDETTGEIVYKKGGGSIVSNDTFDWYLKNEAKGNPLTLANKLWLEAGTLYGREEDFAKVLNLSGAKGFDYTSPHERNPFVYKVYLDIKNPLDTGNISPELVAKLEQSSKKVRKQTQTGGADNWDKNAISPQAWIERLKGDIADGTTYSWVSIPDWVTKTLKSEGFDGIKDTGGKGGGTGHNVWIPFEENQVKSAIGNKGTFSKEKKNIISKATDAESSVGMA